MLLNERCCNAFDRIYWHASSKSWRTLMMTPTLRLRSSMRNTMYVLEKNCVQQHHNVYNQLVLTQFLANDVHQVVLPLSTVQCRRRPTAPVTRRQRAYQDLCLCASTRPSAPRNTCARGSDREQVRLLDSARVPQGRSSMAKARSTETRNHVRTRGRLRGRARETYAYDDTTLQFGFGTSCIGASI